MGWKLDAEPFPPPLFPLPRFSCIPPFLRSFQGINYAPRQTLTPICEQGIELKGVKSQVLTTSPGYVIEQGRGRDGKIWAAKKEEGGGVPQLACALPAAALNGGSFLQILQAKPGKPDQGLVTHQATRSSLCCSSQSSYTIATSATASHCRGTSQGKGKGRGGGGGTAECWASASVSSAVLICSFKLSNGQEIVSLLIFLAPGTEMQQSPVTFSSRTTSVCKVEVGPL